MPALLAEMSTRHGAIEAVVGGEVRWTYAELQAEVARCARALAALGVAQGDRVGILMGNRPEWLVIDFAVMSLGAIAVGLNTWATARELAYQLEHAGIKTLALEARFRNSDFVALVAEARTLGNDLPGLSTIICVGDGAPAGTLAYATLLERAHEVPAASLEAAAARINPDDVACLLYTSGSTALPKGVPLLHGGLIDNMWEIGERQHLVAGDRMWLAVSLFWSLASVNAAFALLTHGGTLVLQHHFDAAIALDLIERERCSVFYGTPNMILALWEHPARTQHDLSSLRTGVTIGTPEQIRRAVALGVTSICNVYGLTEAYGNSTVMDGHAPLELRALSVGRALPGVEVRIVDGETGAAVPAGQVGEIQLKGRLLPGYWNDPVRTAEAFTVDGRFRTGDLGLMDADGYLYYRGRLKELVKTGGINVAPAEVEEVLARHPAVELAFVTGVPDARLDEALAAVIVLRAGASADADALARHCRDAMAAYKLPRHFRFVSAEALPLTSTGKLQRNRLATLFEDKAQS